ncbi:MAG: hypothetical protein ABIH42_11045 [Planctomycetota bacterium]
MTKELSPIFEFARSVNLIHFVVAGGLILLCSLIIRFAGNKKKLFVKYSLASSIGTTGFFGMTISLIIILSFQCSYGYVYQIIGFSTSLFMLGVAGGTLIAKYYFPAKRNWFVIICIELSIIILSLLIPIILSHIKTTGMFSLLFVSFCFINLVVGMFIGAEFTAAANLYFLLEHNGGSLGGILYASDLIGAAVGALIVGSFLIPILGMQTTCYCIVILKSASIILLLLTKKSIQF